MKVFSIHPHDFERDPWTIRITAIASEVVKKDNVVTICYFYAPLSIAHGRTKFQKFTHNKIKLVKLKRTGNAF